MSGLDLVSSNVLVVYEVCRCCAVNPDCDSPDCFNGLLPLGTADLNPLLTGFAVAGALTMAERCGAAKAIAGEVVVWFGVGSEMRYSIAEEAWLWLSGELSAELDSAYRLCAEIVIERDHLRRDRDRLHALINTPHTDEFFAAVRAEAAHQIERWGAAHDEGKADSDWFWLIGYLAGKALRGDEKRMHHIITTAAACLNWWRHATGTSTEMRPGIAEPKSDNARIGALDALLEARGLNR